MSSTTTSTGHANHLNHPHRHQLLAQEHQPIQQSPYPATNASLVPISGVATFIQSGGSQSHQATRSAILDSHQLALNYSTLGRKWLPNRSAVLYRLIVASFYFLFFADDPAVDSDVGGSIAVASPLPSTETLLRNIQSLVKVAADNARRQERQISHQKGEFPSYSIWIKCRGRAAAFDSCRYDSSRV